MYNQCIIFAPILRFELVEALVPIYTCTTTNKNICLCVYAYIYIYIYIYICVYVHVSVYYVYVYIIVQLSAHRSMKCYRSPMTISI